MSNRATWVTKRARLLLNADWMYASIVGSRPVNAHWPEVLQHPNTVTSTPLSFHKPAKPCVLSSMGHLEFRQQSAHLHTPRTTAGTEERYGGTPSALGVQLYHVTCSGWKRGDTVDEVLPR